MSSSEMPATRQALHEMGIALSGANTDITSLEGATRVNADNYFLSGTVALQRLGDYLAIMGPDGRQLFAGGSQFDEVRYFTGNAYLFRTNSLSPLARFDVNGITVNGNFLPTIDNGFTFGSPDKRAATVYAATGAINTSDAREKTPVSPLTDQEIAAAKAMAREVGVFKWLAAIEKKGDDAARLHIGMTVQRVMEIMEAHGLDAVRYGLICHDTWDAVPVTPAVEAREPEFDEDGVVTDPGELGRPAEPGREAGDRFGFRVDQLLLFLARGFDARLSTLEARQA